jgi:D-aspartate ligase
VSDLAPALLADPAWYGTLAAARDLGSRGVPVTLALDHATAPARFSRSVARTVRYPGPRDPDRLLEWLLDFGRRWPGHVLYPTSDNVAWLVASHRARLACDFRLFSPPLDALARLLDKRELAASARAAGLDALDACCPRDEHEVAALASSLRFPVFLKPRTQVFATVQAKGERVSRAQDLVRVWLGWRRRACYPRAVRDAIEGVELPLVQATVPPSERVFTVDGFVDARGELAGVLGCVKVLQRPRRTGPGLCFEHAAVPDAVSAGLARLFQQTGFCGVFDAEFVEHEGRLLLIDVNPRFYNHMQFEIDRGLPLPWLAYLAAIGDEAALCATATRARRFAGGPLIYVHRLPLRLMLAVQTLNGAMTPAERQHWRRWLREASASDPVAQPGDRVPALAELLLELRAAARHPRAWLRGLRSS